MSAFDDFRILQMESKYCNTSRRSMQISSGTMLGRKRKKNVVTFHESILVSIWTFQMTLGFYRHSSKNKFNRDFFFKENIKIIVWEN